MNWDVSSLRSSPGAAFAHQCDSSDNFEPPHHAQNAAIVQEDQSAAGDKHSHDYFTVLTVGEIILRIIAELNPAVIGGALFATLIESKDARDNYRGQMCTEAKTVAQIPDTADLPGSNSAADENGAQEKKGVSCNIDNVHYGPFSAC